MHVTHVHTRTVFSCIHNSDNDDEITAPIAKDLLKVKQCSIL